MLCVTRYSWSDSSSSCSVGFRKVIARQPCAAAVACTGRAPPRQKSSTLQRKLKRGRGFENCQPYNTTERRVRDTQRDACTLREGRQKATPYAMLGVVRDEPGREYGVWCSRDKPSSGPSPSELIRRVGAGALQPSLPRAQARLLFAKKGKEKETQNQISVTLNFNFSNFPTGAGAPQLCRRARTPRKRACATLGAF